MAKSQLEREIEKQRKQEARIARETKNREYAKSIVSGTAVVDGFRVMDKEAEQFLEAILDQYDGNGNNCVSFQNDGIPGYLRESQAVQFEKLKLYGMLSSVIEYGHGGILTITDTSKSYFENKRVALEEKERAEEALKQKMKKAVNEPRKKYDVFISHASADKESYVDDLVAAVKNLPIEVFYDTDVISWGDNWKEKILEGTTRSEFAIIVISEKFFGREWTERELQEFLARQNESGQKVILPLLLRVAPKEIKEQYPFLKEIQYITAEEYGLDKITLLLAGELIKRYRDSLQNFI